MKLDQPLRNADGSMVLAFDSPRPDGMVVAMVGFPNTGETREQTVQVADALRVREATVLRRMDKYGSDATPHLLVG